MPEIKVSRSSLGRWVISYSDPLPLQKRDALLYAPTVDTTRHIEALGLMEPLQEPFIEPRKATPIEPYRFRFRAEPVCRRP